MNRPRLKLLLVEDSAADAELLLAFLGQHYDMDHQRVETAEALRERLHEDWDIVLSDHSLPRFDGMKALLILRELKPQIPFVMVSGNLGEERAVEIMRAGAKDYVMKDHFARLLPVIQREIADSAQRQTLEAELQKKEEQLRHSQKMEAIGSLAGGIAHDFNNILAVVLLHCQEVMTKITAAHPAWHDMRQIERSMERASSLTKQLLAFSRRQVIQPKAIDLNRLLLGIEELLHRVIGEDVRLDSRLNPAISRVFIDPGQLEQVVMNLVVNARDAMPSGGRISITTDEISVSQPITLPTGELRPGTYVEFSLEDNGRGMDASTLARIFEPFFTTKGLHHGTGLGLAMVYGILTKAGGGISVDSEPGRGTTFRILLPSVDLPADQEPERPPELVGGTETILLVEDQADLQDIIRSSLERFGYSVFVAGNSGEAANVFRAHAEKIDLLITDVVLPEFSGIDLAAVLKNEKPSLRVLFVSGYLQNDLVEQSVAKGEAHFLQKPFPVRTLLEKIRQMMEGAP